MASLPYFATCTVCTYVWFPYTNIYEAVTSMFVCDCLWYSVICWGTCTWLKSYFVVYFYTYIHMTSLFMALVGFFLFMIIMVCTSPRFTQNVRCFGDYTATFISESIFSRTVLTIVQPHLPYCISYYFKDHALNCGWLWCWLYHCCPAPVTVACPCSLHCNDSSWYTTTHNMSYSCVEWGYVFEHTVWDYNYR